MLLTKTIKILYIIAFSCLIAYLSLSYRFAFNYETYLNQQYALVFFLPVAAIILIWLFIQRDNYGYSLYISLLLIICFSLLLHFSKDYTFGNELFFTLGIITLSSYSLYLLKSIKTIEIVVLCFVAIFIYQLYIGVYQTYNNKNPLSISGSLQNSGVFAYYLVCNLPLLYWFSFYFSKRWFNARQVKYPTLIFIVAFILISILVFYLAIHVQSRTAMISLIVGMCSLVVYHYKRNIIEIIKSIPNILKLAIGLISITTLIWFSIWIYNFKKLSAVGRLFGFYVSSDHIYDHLWFGTGIGRFTWYYPQWQSSYFEKNPKPNLSFFFCADESYILFNDVLQFFITVGILGFLLCGYGIYRFFKLKSESNCSLLPIVKCTVLMILCCGFTSYPLHVNLLLLLMGSCIAMGFVISNTSREKIIKNPSGYKNFLNKVIISFAVILLSLSSYNGYKANAAVKEWSNIRHSVLDRRQSLSIYEKIYPVLRTDGKFLVRYGALLNTDTTDLFRAISISEEAKERIITKEGIETLVKSYSNAKDYNAAIENQKFLVNYLANKFQPRHDLLKLYIKKNDTLNIRSTCQSILNLPVKINSYQVTKIKKETNDIFEQYY